ncbi:hypothetical protein [Treponema endosymbiont of Eucomonympha sp.]|uniref:hypothetical protein n=1 Tax=Treponema endosymbiont of Eucomonympha sp. TaxID=1580831 RepID=UPI000783DA91|nr:hypothetical protein [Treponema endosymbiont of Eucomonympha sp.]
MTETAAVRNELKGFIDAMSDYQLFALKPLMQVLADDAYIVPVNAFISFHASILPLFLYPVHTA